MTRLEVWSGDAPLIGVLSFLRISHGDRRDIVYNDVVGEGGEMVEANRKSTGHHNEASVWVAIANLGTQWCPHTLRSR